MIPAGFATSRSKPLEQVQSSSSYLTRTQQAPAILRGVSSAPAVAQHSVLRHQLSAAQASQSQRQSHHQQHQYQQLHTAGLAPTSIAAAKMDPQVAAAMLLQVLQQQLVQQQPSAPLTHPQHTLTSPADLLTSLIAVLTSDESSVSHLAAAQSAALSALAASTMQHHVGGAGAFPNFINSPTVHNSSSQCSSYNGQMAATYTQHGHGNSPVAHGQLSSQLHTAAAHHNQHSSVHPGANHDHQQRHEPTQSISSHHQCMSTQTDNDYDERFASKPATSTDSPRSPFKPATSADQRRSASSVTSGKMIKSPLPQLQPGAHATAANAATDKITATAYTRTHGCQEQKPSQAVAQPAAVAEYTHPAASAAVHDSHGSTPSPAAPVVAAPTPPPTTPQRLSRLGSSPTPAVAQHSKQQEQRQQKALVNHSSPSKQMSHVSSAPQVVNYVHAADGGHDNTYSHQPQGIRSRRLNPAHEPYSQGNGRAASCGIQQRSLNGQQPGAHQSCSNGVSEVQHSAGFSHGIAAQKHQKTAMNELNPMQVSGVGKRHK